MDELVKVAPSLPVGSEQRVEIMRRVLQEETEIRKMVSEFIEKHMVEGVDYGVIPGTGGGDKKPKRSLLKPGAEKLTDLFRCTPSHRLMKIEEDFDRGFFNYIFRVRLKNRDTKEVLAEGFGSANSREGRYRWRDAQRKCPICTKTTIFRSKNPKEGWYCWSKKGGCGAQFTVEAEDIVSQAQGKVENDDVATLANTILKMAKKRALVDGAIALARCSDLLTQDLEDLQEHHEPEREVNPPPPKAKPVPPPPPAASKAAPSKDQAPQTGPEKVPTLELKSRVRRVWVRSKMDKDRFRSFVRGVLGSEKPSTEWNEDEVSKVEDALEIILKERADETAFDRAIQGELGGTHGTA